MSEAKPAPQPVEEIILDFDEKDLNFSFKQLRKIALGDDISQYNFTRGDKLSLICSSNLYGIIFIAKPNGFIVFPSSTLVNCHESNYKLPLSQTVTANQSGIKARHYEIGSPFFLSLNSDNSVLICLTRNTQNVITAAFYDISSFSPESSNSNPNAIFPLADNPNLLLTDFQWNPTKPESFAVCFSNGQSHLLQFKLPQSMRHLSLLNSKTSSFCWSPKGKHIAIGTIDGTIEQLSCEEENAKFFKRHPKVANLESLQAKVVHLKWISTYQFGLVYSIQTDSGETEQIFLLKHTKTSEQPVIVNFADLYVQSENAPTFYYTELFQTQKILLTTTGLASEVFVLANQGIPTNVGDWFYANLEESSRAELPLDGTEESFTMGLAIDTTSQTAIPTDKEQLPPHPILLLLTTKGVLCPFHMIYEGMSSLIEPPRVLKSAKHSFNPQEVAKNLSTTTVTVTGGNTPTTAKSTTYAIIPDAQPSTEPIPSQTMGEHPKIVPLTISQATLPTGLIPAPSTSSQHYTIPKIPAGNTQKVPPTNLPIHPPTHAIVDTVKSAPAIVGNTSIAQPALFNITPNDSTSKQQVLRQEIQQSQGQQPKQHTQPQGQQPNQQQLHAQQQQTPVIQQVLQPKQQQHPPVTQQAQQQQQQQQTPVIKQVLQPKLEQQPPVTQQAQAQQQQTPVIQQVLQPKQQQQQPPVTQQAHAQPQHHHHQQPSVMQQLQAPQPKQQLQPITPQNPNTLSHANLNFSPPQGDFRALIQPQTSPTKILQPTSTHIPKQTVLPSTQQTTQNFVQPQSIQQSPLTQNTVSLTMPAPSPLEIEVRYETHIRNEIDEFSEDLETLKNKLRAKFGDFDDAQCKLKDLVGSDEEKNKMYRDTAKLHQELDFTIRSADEMNQILSTIRNEGFHIQEKIEDANKAKKWISSAKFNSFIAATPLDPISEEKRKILIQTYTTLDQRLQEVELCMEDLLIRSNDTNDYHSAVKTIKSQEDVLVKLHSKLDQLSEQVETVKVNRQLSRMNLSASCIHPFELLNKSLEKRHFNYKIQNDRIVELKDYLYNRPTPRVIKPRNPANTLNIPRTVKVPSKPKSDIRTSKPNTPSPISLPQPNHGYKLLVSPQGEFFISPTPQSLPDGCVSVDASHLQKLSPTKSQISPQKGQSMTVPVQDGYDRTSIPKFMVEHKPEQISPSKHIPQPILPSQQQQNQVIYQHSPIGQQPLRNQPPQIPQEIRQQHSQTQAQLLQQPPIPNSQPQQTVSKSPPQKLPPTQLQQQTIPPQPNPPHKDPPRVNRILDFSSPPKNSPPEASSPPFTSVKTADQAQEKPAPNVNPFADPSCPFLSPGPLQGNKQSVTSSNEPTQNKQNRDAKIKTDSPPKSPSDIQLCSLLTAPEPKSNKDPGKNVNLIQTTKPPSKLLQSTNAESKTSPTKSIPLDESQTVNIPKNTDKTPHTKDLNLTQTINISEIGNNTKVPAEITPAIISQNPPQPNINPQIVQQPLQPTTPVRTNEAIQTPRVQVTSIEGDSEMQDDQDYGTSLQAISLGGGLDGVAKPAPPPMGANIRNPFGGNTSGEGASANIPSIWGSPNPNQFSRTNQPQVQAQPPNIGFGGGQPNFGGTPTLFQGPSLLQGIGGTQQKLFGHNTDALSFGSIAGNSPPKQAPFGQQTNPMKQPGPFGQQTAAFGQQPGPFGTQPAPFGQQPASFGQQPGPFGTQPAPFGQQPGLFGQTQDMGFGSVAQGQGFGGQSSGSMSSQVNEMKGKAFTSYRS
ncbi:Nuclear pore complex protein [Oopsacas minuta]|uniref:Nuclear pore complex protein n=1 Tax=Oopsacas minuta TaxID=111878 RepID=A0AAV7K851_9METZ|nr:Nuclear pore complex protein [Oopsacas minuta]